MSNKNTPYVNSHWTINLSLTTYNWEVLLRAPPQTSGTLTRTKNLPSLSWRSAEVGICMHCQTAWCLSIWSFSTLTRITRSSNSNTLTWIQVFPKFCGTQSPGAQDLGSGWGTWWECIFWDDRRTRSWKALSDERRGRHPHGLLQTSVTWPALCKCGLDVSYMLVFIEKQKWELRALHQLLTWHTASITAS